MSKFYLRLFVLFALFLASCSVYQPLAIRTSISAYPTIESPIVNDNPVLQTAEFNIYESSQNKDVYFVIPTTLVPIEASRGTPLSIGLERSDGGHLLLVISLGPRSDLLTAAKNELQARSLKIASINYYPIEQLSIRPLTDPRIPQNINYTAIAAPGLTLSPFHILFLVQVRNSDDILAMKKLINSNSGIIIEVTYNLRMQRNGNNIDKPLTVNGLIANTEITSLSM